MEEVKILLIGGPKDRETIVMQPCPWIRFPIPAYEFDRTFSPGLTQETHMKYCTYNIELFRGPNLVRHLGIHEDIDMDTALSMILGRYEK